MTATLVREPDPHPTETLGWLYTPGPTLRTLELPWRDNARRISCIPVGTYTCVWLPVSASGKYRNVYHALDVPGRDGILIHPGNTYHHTDGCILLGMDEGRIGEDRAVIASREAVHRFGRLMAQESFVLEVR